MVTIRLEMKNYLCCTQLRLEESLGLKRKMYYYAQYKIFFFLIFFFIYNFILQQIKKKIVIQKEDRCYS